MTIETIYEIGCDQCGQGHHYSTSIKYSEKCFRKSGGIVTSDGKHFCDKECYKKYKQSERNRKASKF